MARPEGMVKMGGLRCRWPAKAAAFVSVLRRDAKLLSFQDGGSSPEESPRLLAHRLCRHPIFAGGRNLRRRCLYQPLDHTDMLLQYQ